MPKNNPTIRTGSLGGTIFLALVILCWGAVPVLLRYLTRSVDAWTANGFRYPMSAILYWPVLVIAWRSKSLTRETVRLCAIPSLLALAGQVFWALAPYYLTATEVSFFVRFALVWSLLAAMILFQDERQLLKLARFHIGLVLSVIGFLILSAGKFQLGNSVSALGIVIILLCSFFFGLYAVSVRKYLRHIHPLVSFGVVSQIVAVGTLFGMFSLGDYEQLLVLSQREWIVLAVSSVIGIALGHYFMYSAVARLGASIVASAQVLTPFVTLVLAFLILNEAMSRFEWIGGITMIVGAALLLASQHLIVSVNQSGD